MVISRDVPSQDTRSGVCMTTRSGRDVLGTKIVLVHDVRRVCGVGAPRVLGHTMVWYSTSCGGYGGPVAEAVDGLCASSG